MFERYKEDIQCFMEHDPAARSPIEIVLLYPGFKALRSHRKAQWFLNHNMPFIARYISQRTAHKTGIEIHPGAKIGRRVCIDHGNGIVIGETTEVGDDVMIYQGVTLGGTGKEKGKRHPTIGDNVVVSSGAKVLGSFTVGSNSKIGAGSVVLKEVPPNSVVVGVPGRIVTKDGLRIAASDMSSPDSMIDLNHNQLPDPVADYEDRLADYMVRMDSRLEELEEIIKKHREQNEKRGNNE